MKILLLGGPFTWRTLDLPKQPPDVFIPVPERQPFMAVDDPYEPVTADFRVARYSRGADLAYKGAIVGTIYEYENTQ